MQAHISSNYHLLHSLEVPELAPLPAIRSRTAQPRSHNGSA